LTLVTFRRAALTASFTTVAPEIAGNVRAVCVVGRDDSRRDGASAATFSGRIQAEWNGAKWLFTSAEKAVFVATPEKYAPQYGGYCAYAVSRGYTAPADPTAWKIVGGKLYVNYDKKVAELWAKDMLDNIAGADKSCPGVLETSK
jgi:hypothetical protein